MLSNCLERQALEQLNELHGRAAMTRVLSPSKDRTPVPTPENRAKAVAERKASHTKHRQKMKKQREREERRERRQKREMLSTAARMPAGDGVHLNPEERMQRERSAAMHAIRQMIRGTGTFSGKRSRR